MTISWNENKTVSISPPKKPKKITGTRLASILNLNKWCTPFETWCNITRVYEKPFVDNKYTFAGKEIEPLQAQYMKRNYYMRNLITPADMFGEDYFNTTHGDFFSNVEIFGGMWDYITVDENGNPLTLLEMKTTKRSEDWLKDVPEYYALQAALYAYLLGVDNVIMVCSFLTDKDYENPNDYQCSTNNTIVHSFKLFERYPDFENILLTAKEWWNEHIVKGISPTFDEIKDKDIIKELRTNNVNANLNMREILYEAEQIRSEISTKEKRLNELTNIIKSYATKQFDNDKDCVCLNGKNYNWVVTRSYAPKTYNTKQMIADGWNLEPYANEQKTTYRLIVKEIK